MVVGAVGAIILANLGFSVVEALLAVAVMCLGAAALSWRLHVACDGVECPDKLRESNRSRDG
jgi:hypothetical protein